MIDKTITTAIEAIKVSSMMRKTAYVTLIPAEEAKLLKACAKEYELDDDCFSYSGSIEGLPWKVICCQSSGNQP